MNQNKLMLEERCRQLLIKHAGDKGAVVKESGFSYYFVDKCLKKMNREQVPVKVIQENTATMASLLKTAYEQRKYYIRKILQMLDKPDALELSGCHRMPLYYDTVDGKMVKKCSAEGCGKICEHTVWAGDVEKTGLLLRVLDVDAELDGKYLEFLSSMGVISKAPEPPAPPVVQQNAVVFQTVDGKTLEVREQKVIENLKNLTPQQTETLIEKIENVVDPIPEIEIDEERKVVVKDGKKPAEPGN